MKCDTCGWMTTNKFDLLEHLLKHDNGKLDANGIPSLEEQLREARESLQRIRLQFKDEPELLACYEPSAKYLVELLEGKEEQK